MHGTSWQHRIRSNNYRWQHFIFTNRAKKVDSTGNVHVISISYSWIADGQIFYLQICGTHNILAHTLLICKLKKKSISTSM